MNGPFSPISDEDVRQITQLVETPDNSDFDYLEVQVGDLKVTLGKGDAPPMRSASKPFSPSRNRIRTACRHAWPGVSFA